MAPQKSPKIDQKPGKSMLNPPKPALHSKTVHRPRKSFKIGPTWLPKTRPKLKKNLDIYMKSAKAHIAFQYCPQTPKFLPKYPQHHAKIMPKSYQILTIPMPVSCQNQAKIIPRSCENPRHIIPKACKRLTKFQPMLGNIWQKSYPNHTKFIPKSYQKHTVKMMPRSHEKPAIVIAREEQKSYQINSSQVIDKPTIEPLCTQLAYNICIPASGVQRPWKN